MTTRSQMREFGPCLNSISWLASRAELPLFRANPWRDSRPGGTHGLHSGCEMLSGWIAAFTTTAGSTTTTTRGRRLSPRTCVGVARSLAARKILYRKKWSRSGQPFHNPASSLSRTQRHWGSRFRIAASIWYCLSNHLGVDGYPSVLVMIGTNFRTPAPKLSITDSHHLEVAEFRPRFHKYLHWAALGATCVGGNVLR